MPDGPPRRNATPTATPRATTSTPAPSAIARVESSPSSTKPVSNVPPSAPSVPTADSPPTVAPVCSSAASRSFTTAGCAIESTRIAGPVPAPTTASVPSDPLSRQMRPESVDDRPREQHEHAPDDQRRPKRLPRVDDVGQLPAGPRPGRDPQQRDPDRRRVGLERQPDVGGGEPHRQDLEHQDDPGGDEHHGGGEEARHPRSQPANLPRCRPRGGFEVIAVPAG